MDPSSSARSSLTSATIAGQWRFRATAVNSLGMPSGMSRLAASPRHRVAQGESAAQNSKVIERLTKASPARPVAARIETDWVTGVSSRAKT